MISLLQKHIFLLLPSVASLRYMSFLTARDAFPRGREVGVAVRLVEVEGLANRRTRVVVVR